MPIASADVTIQCFIRYGLDYLIAHPEVLDEIFSNFRTDELWKQYGEKEIVAIKQFFTQNEVPVVLSWSLNPSRIPCISVQIAQSTELVEAASMDDYLDHVQETKLASTILDYFVPTNVVTGTDESLVTPPTTVDYSLVRPGHILVDSKNEEYLVTRLYDQGIYVAQAGTTINPTRVKVSSFINTSVRKRHQAAISEAIDIGCHSHGDTNVTLYLYYVLIWMFLRFKPELERRCLDLSTFSASDFNRESQYLGENIFSRFIRVTARSMVSWLDDPIDQIDTLVENITEDN